MRSSSEGGAEQVLKKAPNMTASRIRNSPAPAEDCRNYTGIVGRALRFPQVFFVIQLGSSTRLCADFGSTKAREPDITVMFLNLRR